MLDARSERRGLISIEGAGETHQYLTFLVAQELYAMKILNVKEIIEYGSLTQIPLMPAFICGVINLRGAVVPVIDLLARFGGGATRVGRRTCIVIVELVTDDGRQDIGVVVDGVSEVIDIFAADIEPPPSFGARIRTEFIEGMGKVEERFVVILNMQQVLSVDEMASLAASVADSLGGNELPAEVVS